MPNATGFSDGALRSRATNSGLNPGFFTTSYKKVAPKIWRPSAFGASSRASGLAPEEPAQESTTRFLHTRFGGLLIGRAVSGGRTLF